MVASAPRPPPLPAALTPAVPVGAGTTMLRGRPEGSVAPWIRGLGLTNHFRNDGCEGSMVERGNVSEGARRREAECGESGGSRVRLVRGGAASRGTDAVRAAGLRERGSEVGVGHGTSR